jgi:uncharacterized membrane protein affecting hemolysin expression
MPARASADMNSRTMRLRIILAVLTPLMLSAIASAWLVTTFSRNQLEDQASQFGQAIADQLAHTSTYYLISDDVLSLNVLLDQLLARHNFNFAAVYNPDSKLLAQSGKHNNSRRSFTRDINFQDANLGYLLIELNSGLLHERSQQILFTLLFIHGLIALLTVCLIWFYGDLTYLWVANTGKSHAVQSAHERTPQEEPPTDHCTLLVLKIKPARLVPLDEINQACSLYGGLLETATDEEWLVTFSTSDQLSRSLCCGLLIKEIAILHTGKLHFKAGIDMAPVDELSMLRKQASYLASVSDQNLVVSQRINREILDNPGDPVPGKIVSHQFHSSLTGDGEVYLVETKDSLLEQQARQILDRF